MWSRGTRRVRDGARRSRRVAVTLAAASGLLALTVVWAPSASAAPRPTISATSGLSDGQTITVSGTGFAPNLKGIAVGQCKVGYAGPSDCNLQGGATFRNADGSGSIGTVTLKLASSFGGTDCTQTDCVIAAAPLPSSADEATVAANTAEVSVTFGAPPAEEPVEEPAESAEKPAEAAEVATDLPKTGAGDSLPVLVLGGSALLLTGLGITLLVPAHRRRSTPA